MFFFLPSFTFFKFTFRTSAAESFPVVVTELTFPSVTVESVPFTIQTGNNSSADGSNFTILLVPLASFKRRTLHVPNLMQMREIYCFRSFALDSAHVKFDV